MEQHGITTAQQFINDACSTTTEEHTKHTTTNYKRSNINDNHVNKKIILNHHNNH